MDEARRPPRPVTAFYLERAALAYLERYAFSAQSLDRVLRRKVERRCRLRGEAPEPFLALVGEVVARAVCSGLVDDRRFAEGRVVTLRRRGGSARLIGAKLAAKGVDRTVIAAALADGRSGRRTLNSPPRTPWPAGAGSGPTATGSAQRSARRTSQPWRARGSPTGSRRRSSTATRSERVPLTVIPAKAGSRDARGAGLEHRRRFWILACARMTALPVQPRLTSRRPCGRRRRRPARPGRPSSANRR